MRDQARAIVIAAVMAVVWPIAVRAQEDMDFSDMSGDEMRAAASQYIANMEQVLADVTEMRDDADEDGDLTRVRCVNDKLTRIEGFIRLSTDAQGALDDAVRNEDGEGMNHQLSMIHIADQRVGNLRGEAAGCAGDILTFAGETEQESDIDEGIPDEDVTDQDGDQLDGIPGSHLPEATPFQ